MEIFGDNLVLIEKIASGGMGEVFFAKMLGKNGFQKNVAVKRIHARLTADPEIKSMFAHEAKLSASLHHPNIIQAFGNGEYNDHLYLVMEYIDGCTLHNLLGKLKSKNEAMPIDIVLLIICQACEGLAYAHDLVDESSGKSLNLIHRDLSPDNIMLSFQGHVKVVDFGIVKTTDSVHTRTGNIRGKISHMSPQQVLGVPLDKRSDIFSLCTIAWEALAMRKLFHSDSEFKTLQLVEKAEIPPLWESNPEVQPDLENIILKGLKKDPDERYQTCRDVLLDLKKYLKKNFPHSDQQKLAEYLQKHYAEEIAKKNTKRETNRVETENFIQEARVQLENNITSTSKIMQNVKDAEQVSRIMQTASTHRGQKIMIAGFTSIVLLIAGFIVYQLKTDGQRISVESSTAELQLPHIFNSKLYPQIVKLEKTLSQMRLSRITENWRYWDRAEEPPSDWNMPAFVDLSWPEGTAPLGYAEENINTQISFGVDIKNKNPTAYFRRKFNIDNINDLNKFILVGLRRDDAAVVYINGTNVYSDDFNSFPVTHTTRPVRMMASVSDEQGYIYFSFDRKFLNNGENTFAVEVHQHRPDSSDLSMEAFITSWIKK